MDYNRYSTIPNVPSARASGSCLFCRKALFRLYDFACVNRDLNNPARFGENDILLLGQLLRDCYLAGADARSEFLTLQTHWTSHLPCGVGTLEAQPDRGRKKPIHPIILSMTQWHHHGLIERLTTNVTLLRNMKSRVQEDWPLIESGNASEARWWSGCALRGGTRPWGLACGLPEGLCSSHSCISTNPCCAASSTIKI